MCRDGMSCHLQYCCQIFMYIDIILEQPDFHAVFPSNQEEFLKSSFTLYQRFDIHVNEKTILRQWLCLAGHVMKRVFLSSRRRHTRSDRDWSSDVCSSD